MVIKVTDEMTIPSPTAQDTRTGTFIGAISFLCVALCVAVVVGGAVGAVLLVRNRRKRLTSHFSCSRYSCAPSELVCTCSVAMPRLTTASGAAYYHMFKEDYPSTRGPLPPIPEGVESANMVPITSNPAYQADQADAWLCQLQSGVEHTYELMP